MFSRLDPIFKTQLRHAETMDTRQGINRQDKTKSRRGGDDADEKESGDDLWEDHTTVSISALRSFLEQLAGETVPKQTHKEDAAENIAVSEEAGQKGAKAPASSAYSPNAAKAAQAYQRTYDTTHNEEAVDVPASAIPSIELRPDEIRVIHGLIDALSILAQKNITEITIRKSESFLQSLVNAVDDLKRT